MPTLEQVNDLLDTRRYEAAVKALGGDALTPEHRALRALAATSESTPSDRRVASN